MPALTRKFASNTLFQFAGKIGGAVIALLALVFITRYLGAAGYGRFHTALTFIQFSGVIFDLGIYLIVLQDLGIAGNKIIKPGFEETWFDNSWIISNIFTFRFCLNFFYLFLIFIFYFLLPYEPIVKLGILLLAVSNCLVWLNQIIITIFQKEFKTHLSAASELIGRLVFLSATLLFIYFKLPFLFIVLTVVLGFLFNFLSSWFLSRGLIKLKFVLDWAYLKTVLSRTWPVAISILFSLIYFKADSLILSFYRPAYEVGIYGVPYRILETLQQLPLLFMGLALPVLSQAYAVETRQRFVSTRFDNQNKHDQPLPRFYHLLQRSFDTLALMALPIVFGVLALSRPIILLIGGQEFLPSSLVLKILIIPTGFIFLSSLFSYAVIALKQQKAMLKFYFITAVLALSAYLVFIPKYSYWGAAFGTVLAEFLVLAFAVYSVKKHSGFFPKFKVFLKALLASAVMFGIIYPLRSYTLFLTFPLGAAVYFAVLFLVKGIDRGVVRKIFN